MKPRQTILAGVLVVSGWLAWSARQEKVESVIQPIARSETRTVNSAVSIRSRSTGKNADTVSTEKAVDLLQDRDVLIGGARSGTGAAKLFVNQNWTPPPAPQAPPPPPPPEVAPVLPYKYLGKKLEDNMWEVYVSRSEETFIVREQSVIDGNYRVDSIRPPTMILTYLPLNQRQTLPIGRVE